MSTPPATADDGLGPPFIGALLRIVWQDVHRQMLEAIHAAGFTDFQDAHFAVFSYPLLDGVRPSDLARQKRITRQAANYLIGQLEDLGYLERRPAPGGERRLVWFSARGQEVVAVIFACLRRLQGGLARDIGADRFAVFVEVLQELAGTAQAAPA